MKDEVKIYVYGSCRFSERLNRDEIVANGGYGVVICINEKRIDEFSGAASSTTNARMDIIAITEGIKRIKKPSNITVYLANQNIINALTKGWLEKWIKMGFKKTKHDDLWIELNKTLSTNSHTISFQNSKDVNSLSDFKQAELLAKTMSSQRFSHET